IGMKPGGVTTFGTARCADASPYYHLHPPDVSCDYAETITSCCLKNDRPDAMSRMHAVVRHDGAVELGVSLVCVEKLGGGKPRQPEVGTAEIRFDQIGLEKICPPQHRAGEICGAHVSLGQVGALADGVAEIGPQQGGCMQVRLG